MQTIENYAKSTDKTNSFIKVANLEPVALMALKMSFTPLPNGETRSCRMICARSSLQRRANMKVIAIGNIAKPLTPEQRQQIMASEVPATLKLYLDGQIEQFWFRQDKPGVIFLMNAESVEQAKATVEALPLTTGGYIAYELMPVGPLAPLGLLIQRK
jgi:hypothetical protein